MAGDCGVGSSKIHTVEGIEEFCSKLEGDSFCQFSILDRGKVPIEIAGQIEKTVAGIPEGVGWGDDEATRIKPLPN